MSKSASSIAKELSVSGYEFSGSMFLSEGWKLGLSIAGWTLLYAVMYYVLQSFSDFIPFIGPLAFGLVVGPSLSAGLILFIHTKYTTGQSDFGMIFKGFGFVSKLLVAAILTGLILVGVMFPLGIISFFIIGMDSFQEIASIVQDFQGITNPLEIIEYVRQILVTFLPLVLITAIGVGAVGLLFMFTNYFIVLGNCSATEAMGASVKIVKKKFFPIFGLLMVLVFIQMVSAIPLGLGLIVTMPWALSVVYLIFNKTILSRMEGETNSFDSEDILDA